MHPAMETLDTLHDLRTQFTGTGGYLAACTVGPAMGSTRAAVLEDLDQVPDLGRYSIAVESCRDDFARLVGVESDRIAIGSQTSVLASVLAAALPDDAEVLCPENEFSSLVLPFVHAGRGIRVRTAPLATLADAITDDTTLVAFSIVQSATGEVADVEAIVAAASRHHVRTFCDATQAVGWMPVDAACFDALVCHAYKWLSAPRGVAFLALSEEYATTLRPVHAGWYAGADPWLSCYGGDADLAASARRFDVSPAWQAFVGAAPALKAFADADMNDLWAHTTGLAAEFRRRLGLAEPAHASAIVTWEDADGSDLAHLTAAGVIASGRGGRARVAFHVFNDIDDMELALAALPPRARS